MFAKWQNRSSRRNSTAPLTLQVTTDEVIDWGISQRKMFGPAMAATGHERRK
jgi:hypothetical protein